MWSSLPRARVFLDPGCLAQRNSPANLQGKLKDAFGKQAQHLILRLNCALYPSSFFVSALFIVKTMNERVLPRNTRVLGRGAVTHPREAVSRWSFTQPAACTAVGKAWPETTTQFYRQTQSGKRSTGRGGGGCGNVPD